MSLLAQEQPNFQMLFECSPGLQFAVSPNDRYTLLAINQLLLAALARPREQVLGVRLQDVFPADPAVEGVHFCEELQKSLDRVMESRNVATTQIRSFPYRLKNFFREYHWSTTCTPVFDQHENLIYILCQITDLTESLKLSSEYKTFLQTSEKISTELLLRTQQLEIANQQLSANDEYLRQLFENSLDAVIGMNTEGEITHWNPQAEVIFGWTKTEAVGMKMSQAIIPYRYREAHDRGLKHFLRTGEGPILNKRLEMQALTKAHGEIQIELSITSVRTRGHSIFYGVLRDISERTKYLENLKIAKEAAESANFAKSTFLANMSHEIRTPLGAVLGFSELVAEENLDKNEKTRFVKAIRRNGELLSNIINDILDLSKVEAKKLNVEQQTTVVAEIINDIESFLKVKTEDKTLSWSVQCSPEVPKTIKTDPLRLRQIIFNIVGNAVKFTSSGFISVDISLDTQSIGQSKLAFRITDTGIGIDEIEAKNLFQPFTQADPSMKRRFGGVGLGLVISKRLAQLLGGDVILQQSSKGQGSSFYVTIDSGQSRPAMQEISVGNTSGTDKPLLQSELPKLKNLDVLLVDDSTDNLTLVSYLLQASGAQVDTAENGKVAVEKAKLKTYDVILMDLQMPVMDGFEATYLLRQNGYKSPIIALTAHASTKDRELCLEKGFDEHIGKPIHRQTLINGILEVHQSGLSASI